VTPDQEAVVDDHLARLDAAACRAFVADLWAARGFETEVDDDVVVATRRGDSVVVFPACGGRFRAPSAPSRPVDAVVAPAGGTRAAAIAAAHGARLLTAADLRQMLRYAVDPETETALAERHLGAPLTALTPPLRRRVGSRLARLTAPDSPVGSTAVVVVLALVVASTAGFLAFDGALDQPADPVSTPSSAGAATVTERPAEVTAWGDGTDTPSRPTDRDVSVPRSPVDDSDRLAAVPGLNSTGVTNLTALAAAHDRALGTQSYTLWADTYRPQNGVPRAERVQRDTDIFVDGDRYLVEENLERGSDRRLVRAVFYDGTDWFVDDRTTDERMVRWVDGTTAEATVDPDPRVLRTRLLTHYLATPTTNVTGRTRTAGTVRYRLEGSGIPPALATREMHDYRFVAVVDSDGFVREAVVEYRVVSVAGSYDFRFEWTYGRLNATALTEPGWVSQARPATGTERATSSDSETSATNTSTPAAETPA
jgi:hypothetical protein